MCAVPRLTLPLMGTRGHEYIQSIYISAYEVEFICNINEFQVIETPQEPCFQSSKFKQKISFSRPGSRFCISLRTPWNTNKYLMHHNLRCLLRSLLPNPYWIHVIFIKPRHMSGETCICDDSFGVPLQGSGGQGGRRTNRNSPAGAAHRHHILAGSGSSGVAAGLRIILKQHLFTTTKSSPDYLCWSKAAGLGSRLCIY